MRRLFFLLVLAALLAACGGDDGTEPALEAALEAVGERPPGEGQVQPPVPYEVGETKATPGVERGVSIDIVIEPGVYAEELEELFTWFEEVWYSDRRLIQVDVYDNWDSAAGLNFDANRVLATFRYTRPRHREVVIYTERLVAGQRERREDTFRSGTHAVYLGPRSRMFGSQDQAQYMVKMLEDKPNKRVYELSWLSNQTKIVLTFDVVGGELARVREGFSHEVWQGFTPERLKQAAMGGGFGGSADYGGDYFRFDEPGGLAPPEGTP
ncbi:MAG TPA: hypothetical protein ENN88_03705 [Candidatus Coatesbacteria bacterium]|nr:hypothetical protein [Candidatus Coatesbacteria bacterium]